MKKIIVSALAVVAMASCAKENVAVMPGGGEVRISSSIATRVSDNAWQVSDSIGVYMVATGDGFGAVAEENENVKYVTSTVNGDFSATSPLYYPVSGNVDLLAYYPYDADVVVDAYEVNVATQTTPAVIDLMKAERSDVVKNPAAVAMTFHHKLARIKLDISEGAGLEAEDLKGLVVKLTGTKTTAAYDLTAADASAISFDSEDVAADITMLATVNDDKVVTAAKAIVIPQEMSSAKLTFATAEYGTFETSLAIDSFTIGNEYVYNVEINRTGVSISSPTIDPWGDGDEVEDDLDATQPMPTVLTLATVDKDKIGEYADTWIITDDEIIEDKELWGLQAATMAAHGANRAITLIFPNLTTLPASTFWMVKAYKVELPVVETIGMNVFNTSAIKSFEIPASVTSIDKDAFFGADTELVITNKSSSCILEDGVLYDSAKTALMHGFNLLLGDGEITIPESVTYIANSAFAGCSALKKIDLYTVADKSYFGTNVFENCVNLTEVLNLNVAVINQMAFYGCERLTSIDLAGVTEIGSSAFSGCSKLETLTNFDVITIKPNVFIGCALTEVSLSNVKEIWDSVFEGCMSLTSVTLDWEDGDPNMQLMELSPLFMGMTDSNSANTTLTLNFALSPSSAICNNIQVDGESNKITYQDFSNNNHEVIFKDIIVNY